MFKRASPSMMSKCECPVRGWLVYHLPKGEDKDAGGRQFGNAVHDAFEQWTRHGTVPEHPALKAALMLAMPYLPKPGEGTAEGWVKIPFAPGFEISGKYDHRLTDPELVVIDYKTSTQKPKLQHRDAMLTDPQVQAYCLDALDRHPEKQGVTCTWLYLRTKKSADAAPYDRIAHGAPEPITATFTRVELETRRPQLYNRARKALRIVNADDPRQLDTNKNLCYEYGACDVRQYCDRRNEIMSQPDLLAMMAQFKNPAAVTAPATVNLLGGPAVASTPAVAQVAQLPVLESPATVVTEPVKIPTLPEPAFTAALAADQTKAKVLPEDFETRSKMMNTEHSPLGQDLLDAELGRSVRCILKAGGKVSFG
jgi:hypothetical protein